MIESIREGGPLTMFLVVIAVLLHLVSLATLIVVAKVKTSYGAIGFLAGTIAVTTAGILAIGILGQQMGLAVMVDAVESASRPRQQAMLDVGTRVANIPMAVALGSAVFPGLTVLASMGKWFKLRTMETK